MWTELMAKLDDDGRTRLEAVMTRRPVKAGEVLFWEGDPGDALYVIDRGHVMVEKVTEQGETVAVAILSAGSIVGEQALLGDDLRGATVRTLTKGSIRTLSRAAFMDLRRTHPVFDQLVIVLLDGRVRELNELVMEARHSPVEQRVKRRLRDLESTFGAEIPLTQATLAALAGTTRPTTNTILQELQAEGTLELRRGRIVINDASGLGNPLA